MTELNEALAPTMDLESPNPLAAAGEALQSFAGHIGAGLRSGYEAVRDMPRNLKTYAAIGTTAVTLLALANAETATADTDSVTPEGNVPALIGTTLLSGVPETSASTATTTSDPAALQQECVQVGMEPVHITAAKMHGVHKDHGNGWYGRVRGRLDGMPAECTDNGYYRVLNGRIQLQNGDHHQQWSMIYPWSGSEWNGHRNNKGMIDNDAVPGYGPAFQNVAYEHNPNWTKWAYICSPGAEKTQARFQEEHTVIQTDGTISEYGSHIAGKIQILAGPKILNRPIEVSGAC